MSNTRLNVGLVADSVSTNNFDLSSATINEIPYNASMLVKDESGAAGWGNQTVVVRDNSDPLIYQENNCQLNTGFEIKFTFRYYIQPVFCDILITNLSFNGPNASIVVDISSNLPYRPKYPSSLSGNVGVIRANGSTFPAIVTFISPATLKIDFGSPSLVPLPGGSSKVSGQIFYERDVAEN